MTAPEADPNVPHEFGRETAGRQVRAVCTCGKWVGPWRHQRAYLVEKSMHSDESEHLSAVRRAARSKP